MDIDDILAEQDYVNLDDHLKGLMQETAGDDLVERMNDDFFRKFFPCFKDEESTLDWYFSNIPARLNPDFNNHRPYDVCKAGKQISVKIPI